MASFGIWSPPPMRIYKHLNPGAVDAHPTDSTRARIASPADLHDWLDFLRSRSRLSDELTVTFIVDTDGFLWVADRHSEHAACAQGRDVLSAGELTFAMTRGAAVVSSATNQSLGYCPEAESWPAVAAALTRAGVEHPEGFTAELTFRLCSSCGAKNVVKDDWFECGVCETALSRTWNFM